MKKVLILVVVLLIAGGGGAFFMLGGKSADVPEPEPRKAEKFEVPEHHYVRLDTITVTLFEENAVAGLYTAAMTLEIAELGQREIVSEAKSPLRDAMFCDLHSLVECRKRIDIPLDLLKRRMRAIAICELDAEVVIDLYVENVLRKGQLQKDG
jgi:hypothetical protein